MQFAPRSAAHPEYCPLSTCNKNQSNPLRVAEAVQIVVAIRVLFKRGCYLKRLLGQALAKPGNGHEVFLSMKEV